MSHEPTATRVLDEAPDGYQPTLHLAWIDGIAEHDQWGNIPPTLCQLWTYDEARFFGEGEPLWIIVPSYRPDHSRPQPQPT